MPAETWEANQLQAVLFLKQPIAGTDVFSELAGEQPQSREEHLKEGVRAEAGPFSNGILQVIVGPIRVDVLLSPSVGADTVLGASPTLGDFGAKLKEFASLVRKWLPRSGIPISRLSLVAKALAPAGSIVSAYEILKANLSSVRVEPGKMLDIMFRVNWRAESGHTQEGYLNRLTTWATVTVATRASVPGGPQVTTSEKYYAYREIDVSTPLEHTDELPAEKLAPIFDEIYELVVSTAETGERP